MTIKGVYIDMSQSEAGISALSPAILDYSANNRSQGPIGNRSSCACPHGGFRCRGDDRWCAISISEDKEWESFCRVVGRGWTEDPRFTTLIARKENEDELERLVEEWTLGFSAEEVMTKLQEAGVPAGVVQNCQDLASDRQLRYRQHFRTVEHPEIGSFTNATPSFRLSKTPCKLKPSPCLGEHNDYVYKEILGMSDEELVSLLAEGVFY